MKRIEITRRGMLHGILAAGVAPYLMPSSMFGGDKQPAPSGQINVACIGMGGIMGVDLPAAAAMPGVNIVALCDVHDKAIADSRQKFKDKPDIYARVEAAKHYSDYRLLLEKEKSVDAVIIATPDHWHAPIATAAIQAGKHVYCEKPLTHSVGESRRLRQIAGNSRVVTQMGNQGSATSAMRRNMEVIQAGLLGQVREVHIWHPSYSSKTCGSDRPQREDTVPAGFNWDFWVGPAQMRPYLQGEYHPFSWRYWYDFGNGSIGDFCGHAFNLPVRALKLGHPISIDVAGEPLGKETYVKTCHLTYNFPARGELAPAKIHFHHGGLPPAEALEGFADTFGNVPGTGCLLVGDEGTISAGLWNADGYLRMKGDKKYRGVAGHEAAKEIPVTIPRVRGHMNEWIDACRGEGKTFSNFDIGGLVTEIGLAGVLPLRLGHDIDWDGNAMKVPGFPDADQIINPQYRSKWL